MTTEQKLKALNFKETADPEIFEKNYYLGDVRLKLVFDISTNIGTMVNTDNLSTIFINNFTELLKLNQFYEKKPRVSTRHASQISSTPQKNV